MIDRTDAHRRHYVHVKLSQLSITVGQVEQVEQELKKSRDGDTVTESDDTSMTVNDMVTGSNDMSVNVGDTVINDFINDFEGIDE